MGFFGEKEKDLSMKGKRNFFKTMNQKGFSNTLVIILALVIIGGIGGYFIFVKKSAVTLTSRQESTASNAPTDTSELVIQETKEFNIKGLHPKFAPDGSKILFEARGENEGLWIMNSDGSNLESIYKGKLSGVDDDEYSLDGKFIFVTTLLQTGSRFPGSNDEVLNVINTQTNGAKQIFGPVKNILYTKWISNNEVGFVYENEMSRENFAIVDVNGTKKNYEDNGKPIFFYTSDRGTGAGDQSVIKSVTRSGTTKEITGAAFTEPALSPDGQKVVYRQYGEPGQLMTMSTDGSDKNVVITDYGAGDATWSPSGKIISYSVAKDDGHAIIEWDIYAINTDGTGKIKLTNSGKKFAAHPRWSPDGKKLVFDYNETGSFGLIVFK